MKIDDTTLPGVQRITTEPVGDSRGRFERLFCSDAWQALRPGLQFAQVNLSSTAKRGTVRGLHFQRAPAAEAKLIRCVRGRVFDVAVDLRAGSPTFLRWQGVELAEDRAEELFIPEGFAHGFQALEDDVQLLYFHTAAYSPQHEGGIRHDDPALGITWPLPISEVSPRDRALPPIGDSFEGLRP